MDITKFVVSSREKALLYGDYSTYRSQLSGRLLNTRKKLNIASKNRGKFHPKEAVSAEQISGNHEYLHLQLLTAERAWAHALSMKAAHSADNKGINGKTRSHIVSRLDKAARLAEQLADTLSDTAVSGASSTDVLEARAYAALLHGAGLFERQHWEASLKSYAVARIIYSALSSLASDAIFRDLLSETIDPSIRYAAYQVEIPRTEPIPTIARKAFPHGKTELVGLINELDPNVLKHGDHDAKKGLSGAEGAPTTLTWRSREVKIEDAAISVAWGAVNTAKSVLAEKLSSSTLSHPRDRAAAYDDILIATQDTVDATKQALDELKSEGVPQSDPRMQSLQITRTAVSFEMISWRIGRNRVLAGEADGAAAGSLVNPRRRKTQADAPEHSKDNAPGRQIARLKEKVVLYDGNLQSIESVVELPGVANDQELSARLAATSKYFASLKALAIARSYSVAGNTTNALALTKHAFELCQEAGPELSAESVSKSTPPNILVTQDDAKALYLLLSGELQQSHALVEISNLRKANGTSAEKQSSKSLAEHLAVYPVAGVDLENIVTYPPRIEPVPVKPLFLDAAWNYIDYPDKQGQQARPAAAAAAAKPADKAAPESEVKPQKRGWFGFGRIDGVTSPTAGLDITMGEIKSASMDGEAEQFIPRPARKRFPRNYIITIVALLLGLVILGLGFGYGLRHRTLRPAVKNTIISAVRKQVQFVVPIEKLVNEAELDLKTGFTVSDVAGVREYVFNLTQRFAAPDGVRKKMILVNGQSPGPLIEANIGDTIRIHVHNHMPHTSTSIHWHGIDQKNSTMMDGVTGVTQCAIPPGGNFTYEFKVVDQRGTFWYHSHTSVQYTDGLFGPIVIHDADERVPKVDDEKIIFLGGHFHTYAGTLLKSYLQPGSHWAPSAPGVEPLPDNFIMNGKNTHACSIASTTWAANGAKACSGGELYHTNVTRGHSVRLRLISHSSFTSFWFSIDNHTLTIVEIDGIEVQPISARGVYVNIGQRYSVIVHANQTAGNYFMRATLPRTCFLPYAPYVNPALESSEYQVRGVLSYGDTDWTAEPIGAAGNVTNPYGVENNGARGDVWEGCLDMPFDVPVPMREEKAYEVDEANKHRIQFQFQQAGDVNRIFVNRTSWSTYTNTAQLWEAMNQTFTPGMGGPYNNWNFQLNQQVLLIPEAGKGVQVVINSLDNMEHPWHLHGHSFQIVGWGEGVFRGDNTKWNLENPMRRDTVTMPAFSHLVIRFMADNPGIWAMHCHVAWHMEGGMFVSFIERPEDLKRLVDNMDPATRELAQSFCKTPLAEGNVR